MYLLDTNVLSELARPRPNLKTLAWVEALESIAISAITVEEIAFGIARAQPARRVKLAVWFDKIFESVDVHDVTQAIARASAELRAARAVAGRPVAQADMLIAATALIHGLTLATRNVGDFADCGVTLFDPFI